MFISNAISSCAISSVQNPSKSSSSVSLLNRSINQASRTGSRVVLCSSSLISEASLPSSSLALGALVIPAFLRPFVIAVTFTAFHARITQLQTSACVALLIFPVSVKVWIPSDIHFSHSSQTWFLNDRLTEMSNGCDFLVRPPGITAVVVLCSVLKVLQTFLSICALKLSKMSREVLSKDTGLGHETFSPHTAMPSLSIHPLLWQWTTTPLGRFSFGIVFLLKMTIGLSFFPDSEHARTTVKPFSRDQWLIQERFQLQLCQLFWNMEHQMT